MNKKSLSIIILLIIVLGGSAYGISTYRREVASLESDLEALEEDYSSLKETYSTVEENYLDLQSEMEKLTSDYEDLSENYENLQQDYQTYVEAQQYTVREKTLTEVEDFLQRDTTSENEYVEEDMEYVCYHFTHDMMVNAIEEEIAVGFVYLYLDSDPDDPQSETEAHSLVAFKTIDEGVVYVEPQHDAVMKELE